ncbi:hypothetical protein GCM10025858_30730 [Alicyclobacillus sacchari]|nr:hypothetical protein GCM10025858_30730 [Alicyclobacillus sacchari]
MQLDDLYRQVIMDHYQHPRNQGQLADDAIAVDLRNPSCGDEIRLQLLVEDGVVKDVRFRGSGCSISMASASMMTDAIKGKSIPEALQLAQTFREMVKGELSRSRPTWRVGIVARRFKVSGAHQVCNTRMAGARARSRSERSRWRSQGMIQSQ